MLDAAVRPDLSLGAPVQLKQAVVAGDSESDAAAVSGSSGDFLHFKNKHYSPVFLK